jgi:LPXTG-motif cell wall-anchored protein
MRKLVLVVGAALVLALGAAPAAHAVDYPLAPVSASGTTIGSHADAAPAGGEGTVGPANAASTNSSLPFTGADSRTLVWLGVAFVGAGAFGISGYRRRARTS